MPQEIPAWRDYARMLKIVRQSTLGKKKNEFESKSQLDELFENFDSEAFVAGKEGQGTLTFKELNKGLLNELKDRTRLKHSDELVVDSVSEALRRGFMATRNLSGGGEKQLDREELRILLIYLEHFFELLHMFKVVELEKGEPAKVKSGGDERPVRVGQLEFSRSVPTLKAWGLTIGKPAEAFRELTHGTGAIGFDGFAEWACKASLEFIEPEAEPEAVDYEKRAKAAAKALNRSVMNEKAATMRMAEAELAKKRRLEATMIHQAVGGAGQYIRPGSTLAVTTSANVISDYNLDNVALYDIDGDGELDVGKEQEAARKAHKRAVKSRMAAEREALRLQNVDLKKRRDHMRYVR